MFIQMIEQRVRARDLHQQRATVAREEPHVPDPIAPFEEVGAAQLVPDADSASGP